MIERIRQAVSVLYHYFRLRDGGRRWRTRAAFESWQHRRVVRHLRFVRRRSSFYRKLWGDRPLEHWRTFPMIDKRAMMEQFDELNTAGVRLEEAMRTALASERSRDFRPSVGRVSVGLSSGTSGNRGLFLVDERERNAWVGAVLAKVLHGPPWRPARIAFFLRANNNLYESVGKSKLQFRYFDLLDPIERHIARLNDYQPTVLVAPPSMLRALARAKRNGTLVSEPERIVSVAEVLETIDADAIRAAFAAPLHQVYQCTEGFVASACAYGTLHLNEDIVCIQKEAVPGGGRRFVPIVTDFSRRTQPIVRYRLNDILVEAETPCPCGSVFTVIERIEGRCDDVLYFPSVQGRRTLVPMFADYVSRAIVAASPHVEEYRVAQVDERQLELALLIAGQTHRDEAEASISSALHRLFAAAGVETPELVYVPYDIRPGTTKLRRIERRFAIDDDLMV
ncbi:hypothetical protein MO973_18380 [Paenibacillus sp. TRM 82003]|nr:hypothetical protein [Paenibacillus sp. TRM 82003]